MPNYNLINKLVGLKEDLFDQESYLLRDLTPSGDMNGNKIRKIAKLRELQMAVSEAIIELGKL